MNCLHPPSCIVWKYRLFLIKSVACDKYIFIIRSKKDFNPKLVVGITFHKIQQQPTTCVMSMSTLNN